VRCIWYDYNFCSRGMYQVLLQVLAVGRARPEIMFRSKHESRNIYKGSVPQLPPGGQVETLLKRTVWGAKTRRCMCVCPGSLASASRTYASATAGSRHVALSTTGMLRFQAPSSDSAVFAPVRSDCGVQVPTISRIFHI
jgi:hypothetical protein